MKITMSTSTEEKKITTTESPPKEEKKAAPAAPAVEPTPIQVVIKGFQEAKDKKAYLDGLEKEPSAEGYEFLSAVYSNGVDGVVEKDSEKTKGFLNEGSKLGSTACMISLGESLSAGEPGKARSLLEAALDKKDWRAANSLGVLAMRSGQVDEALAKFELADSHNVPNSANNLCITRIQKASTSLSSALGLLQKCITQFSNSNKSASS